MKKYDILEHTADFAIRVYGAQKTDLLINGREAIFSEIIDYQPKPKISRVIEIKSESFETLVVDWLNELISLFYSEGFLAAECKINIDEAARKLYANVRGENIELKDSIIKTEIKAVTYHNLCLENRGKIWSLDIVVDV
jgi:SHS2 domain-containing protein